MTAERWEEFAEGSPGVAFLHKPGMQALPRPTRGADIRELRRFVNLRREGDFVLQVGLLLGMFRP